MALIGIPPEKCGFTTLGENKVPKMRFGYFSHPYSICDKMVYIVSFLTWGMGLESKYVVYKIDV